MEGRVRSGYFAADAVVVRLAPNLPHRSFLMDDLRCNGRRESWPEYTTCADIG